jgi:Tfp pilus assembly protein PilN
MNLIPAEDRRGAGGIAGRTGGVAYVIVGALALIVGIGVLYAMAVHQVADRKTTLAQVTGEVSAVQAQANELQPYLAFQAFSKQRIESVAQLAQERFDWPLAMQQIALALPSNVTLTDLTGTATAPTTTGATAAATGSSGATGTTGTTVAGTPSTLPTTSASAAGLVNAPSLSLSGCANGSPSVGQTSVATLLARLRALKDVASATVSEYGAGTCTTFAMTVNYNNDYAVPSTRLTASADTTVGH